jgi:hypothetical protein
MGIFVAGCNRSPQPFQLGQSIVSFLIEKSQFVSRGILVAQAFSLWVSAANDADLNAEATEKGEDAEKSLTP